MPDNPKKAKADDDSEIDSVMADEESPPIGDAAGEPGTSPAPQSIASTGLFVPEASGPEPREREPTRDELIKAQLDFQRQMVAKLKAREAKKEAGRQPSAKAEPDVDIEAFRFAALKKKFFARKAAGKIEVPEEIAFLRAESAEIARQRKLRQDAEFDNPATEVSEDDSSDVFLDQAEAADRPGLSSDDEPKKRRRQPEKVAESGDRPSKRTKKSRKVGGQEYSHADLQEVLDTANKSRKKASEQKSGSKKAAKTGPSMTNTSSLWGNDVFKEAARNADLPDQPTFDKTGRRADAMKQLIASVPTEARDIAKYDQRYLDAAIKDFAGTGSVKPGPDGTWCVRAIKTPLKSYQIMGSAFMIRREGGNDKPRGGILADAMGLGKTLQMLTTIVNCKPRGKGARRRTTLIVASPALVNQWFQEIQTHCMRKSESKEWGMGAVFQHRAGHRLDSNLNEEMLETADIILTTYSEVCRSYPRADVPKELTKAKDKDEWWTKHYDENRGILHRLKFLRVVLDEAQQIKNHKSVSSMACRALDARHHWAITGTPVYNTVAEFYSIFKFLREPHTGSYKLFRANFCDPSDPESLEKLNVFLRKLMVRRTHDDTLFNCRLLNLPTPSQRTVKLAFSGIEREVYETVKNRMISRINSISRKEGHDGLQRRFSHIWTLILRLRQLCGHILLVQGTMLDHLEREDYEKLNRLCSSEEELSNEGLALMLHLKEALSARATLTTVDGKTGASITETQINATGTVDIAQTEGDVGRMHGIPFNFAKYLEHLAKSDKWNEIVDRSRCVACQERPTHPYISDCWHIYCLQCLTQMQHLAARRGQDQMACSECGQHYGNAQPCRDLAEAVKGRSSPSPTETQDTAGKDKKKSKASKEDDWINLKGVILPSAKTRAAKAQILNWIEEDKDVKIVVYTQFLPMIRILEKVCIAERWSFSKYAGNMSHDARAASLAEFSSLEKNKRILLASLRAGGLGLNVTAANKVLLLDPWWNSAVEQQAFARVYRIGQQKETELVRLIVTNTIDAAMMAVKARKDEEIDFVMNDEKKKQTLKVEDLMRLFGEVREDAGRPFIFAEGADNFDEEEPEHLRYVNMEEDDEDAEMGNEE